MLSYWLLGAASGVGGAMLVASGHVAWLNRYAWINAAMNLTLSLALTAWLGLEGVALGTAIPYVILHPFITRKLLHEYPVGFRRLVRDAWLPAYATGAALALVLVLVRVTVPLESFAAVAVVCAAGVLAAWAAYFVVWLRPSERLLVRSLVGR
jgi:O-antigen/teichoic acid export membrane protein